MQIGSVPTDIDQLERRRTSLEIERQALTRESDPNSKQRLGEVEKQLAELTEQITGLRARWETEKGAIQRVRDLKEKIEEAKLEVQNATRRGDYNRASQIQYGELPQMESELQRLSSQMDKTGSRMLKEEVDEEDIARIVSKWTGIPVSKMLEGEVQKLIQMEERLRHRVIGQDEALERVANAIRRSRAGLSDPRRPIGSFIFLGPTGVGKTELARALAEFLFDDEHNIVRIDMSEYMEKHAVSRLIGAPPGYVGYEEGGQLTEAVRRRPYSVVLLDEIEKAHPDVFNILLQILDDGRLTDGKGRTVDFKNTVIIMTSNLGSQFLRPANFDITETTGTWTAEKDAARRFEEARKQVMDVVHEYFKPEFLNRVDDIIIFNPLERNELMKIVNLRLEDLRRLLADRRISVELTDKAKELVFAEGYDAAFGARPLKRAIQRLIQDPLAIKILDGEVLNGDHVVLDANLSTRQITFQVSHRVVDQVPA
jgi:ATP-dependent Clp protease ATP-binding subunit ClpB